MIKKIVLPCFFLLLFVSPFYAQLKIKGFIADKETHEAITGAVVFLKNSSIQSITDRNGHFSIQISKLESLNICCFGYKDTIIMPSGEDIGTIYLEAVRTQIKDVEIKGQQNNKMQSGLVSLSMKEATRIASFLGSSDPIKILQLKPGLSTTSEIDGGIYVRGGDNGQNLVLLDDIPLQNPTHLMGFYSVFQESVVQNIDMYKAAPPARYGGHLSSVTDVKMYNADSSKLTGEASAGFLASNITIKGSIDSSRFFYLLSARQAYLGFIRQVIIRPLASHPGKFIDNTRYQFGDYYAKLRWQTGKHSFLSFSGYYGKDNYTFKNDDYDFSDNLQWGNNGFIFKWINNLSDSWTFSVSNGLSFYNFKMDIINQQVDVSLKNNFQGYFANAELKKRHNATLFLVGIDYQRNKFKPNNYEILSDGFNVNQSPDYYNFQITPYGQLQWQMFNNLNISSSLRFPLFFETGPGERINGQDTIAYSGGQIIKRFINLEPRINLSYNLFGNNGLIKASYAYLTQQIHQIPVGNVSLPTDFWLPSMATAPPETSNQFSVGYSNCLKNQLINYSVDLYYRNMKGLLEINQTSFNNSSSHIENYLYRGTGETGGIEFYVEKKEGSYTGWVSYVYSRSWRKFPDIQAVSFPAKYDRPHDFKIVQAYQLNKKWSFSMVWVYASGSNMSLPVGRYIFQGNIINDYGSPNNFRLPAYHRMDISATRTTTGKYFTTNWIFAVYNVYNRSNPYFYYYKVRGSTNSDYLKVSLLKSSLFPVLPSISLKILF